MLGYTPSLALAKEEVTLEYVFLQMRIQLSEFRSNRYKAGYTKLTVPVHKEIIKVRE